MKNMWQVATQKENTSLNLLYHMCPITPQNKDSNCYLTLCTRQKENYVSE